MRPLSFDQRSFPAHATEISTVRQDFQYFSGAGLKTKDEAARGSCRKRPLLSAGAPQIHNGKADDKRNDFNLTFGVNCGTADPEPVRSASLSAG